MMTHRMARLAGFGAFAVTAGLVALYAFVFWLAFPHRNGIDTIQAHVTWMAVGIVILTLVAIHLVYARILLRVAKGEEFGI
jgi:hypothetical protein